MRRCTFLAGVAASASSLPTRGGSTEAPVIGFLRSTSAADSVALVSAFRAGLKQMGLIDGQTVPRALGVTVPAVLLATADEVIE